ncbi:MAG: 6-pyruvoyl trahydropterin synthase family protein, partial [Mediterraneibacter faecis]
NIHGHRWNVVAKIKSQELEREGQTRGMVVDFGNLKNDLKVFCDYFDHSLIYETGSLKAETVAALQKEEFHLEEVSFRPTAENFAYYFYKKLTDSGYGVHCVEVYETPNNCAVYEEE